jgi:hypothetical protein
VHHPKTHRLAAAAVAVVVSSSALTGCVTTALGRSPTDHDLRNDGSPEAQDGLFRAYEVVYDEHVFRRPGVAPELIAQELHLEAVDDVAAVAWSDDAFNYLSSSPAAADLMEHPAVSFDAFAHSGQGQTAIVGVGIGAGVIAGGVSWFARTTLRDGMSADETNDLWVTTAGGLIVGTVLGGLVASAYSYILPAISAPLATPLYRQAARAFNEDLDDRLLDGAPTGDAPPEGEDDEDRDAADDSAQEAAPDAPEAPATPATPATPGAPVPVPVPAAGT